MLKTYLMIAVTFMSLGTLASDVEMPHLLDVGDANAGAELVGQCAACHGAQGKSIASDWPNLAGQNQRYISEQLKYFQHKYKKYVICFNLFVFHLNKCETCILGKYTFLIGST